MRHKQNLTVLETFDVMRLIDPHFSQLAPNIHGLGAKTRPGEPKSEPADFFVYVSEVVRELFQGLVFGRALVLGLVDFIDDLF